MDQRISVTAPATSTPDIMSSQPGNRKLGLILLSGTVVGSMIGGGSFNRPQNMANDAALGAWALSHATMRNIRQNLTFAFIYNAAGVPVAAGVLYPAFGLLLSPVIAALAMSLSSVSVVTNALRLRGARL